MEKHELWAQVQKHLNHFGWCIEITPGDFWIAFLPADFLYGSSGYVSVYGGGVNVGIDGFDGLDSMMWSYELDPDYEEALAMLVQYIEQLRANLIAQDAAIISKYFYCRSADVNELTGGDDYVPLTKNKWFKKQEYY